MGATGTHRSVVIGAWNARDDMLRCLASLAREVRLPHEVIVVDDGPRTGHPRRSVAVSGRTRDGEARERRVGRGRNDALPMVRGRLVLMLDADTEVRPGAVEALAGVLDQHTQVGLVGPRLVGPDGELQLSCRRYPPLMIPFMRRGPYARLNPDPEAHRRHLMKDSTIGRSDRSYGYRGRAQMWRADLPTSIGPYDHRVSSYGGEDLDWCLRVWAAGLEVRYVPEAEILHVWQQMTRRKLYGRKSFRALRDWYYLQWKHRRLRRSPRLAEANADG